MPFLLVVKTNWGGVVVMWLELVNHKKTRCFRGDLAYAENSASQWRVGPQLLSEAYQHEGLEGRAPVDPDLHGKASWSFVLALWLELRIGKKTGDS
jgi:hypothetical protein